MKSTVRIAMLLAVAAWVLQSASCKKKPTTKTDADPNITLYFKSVVDGQDMLLRSNEYALDNGEMVKLSNWGVIISKVSLIKEDNSRVLLGDGYIWIDQYGQKNKFTYTAIPAGNYKGIFFEFGLDSAINHGDPSKWPANHPLNANYTGQHWGWSGGYIFQVLDGYYRDDKDSATVKSFSYHTVGDQFKAQYNLTMPFSLEKNSNKTATITMDFAQFFKSPLALKIGTDPSSHSGNTAEIAWMRNLMDNSADVYNLIEIK